MGVPWGRAQRPGFTDTPNTKTRSVTVFIRNCQHLIVTMQVLSIYHLLISNLCMVQCTHVRIHCGSISHHGGSHCHLSKIQHTALSPSACEDTLLALLKGKRNQYKQRWHKQKVWKMWLLIGRDFALPCGMSMLDFHVSSVTEKI